MATKACVLVVVNSPDSGPRRLATWLTEAGVEVVVERGEFGLPETLDGVHGLVLLGGGLMPNDYERAPWLHGERALVEMAIDKDFPTLGICLGAQIITEVAGGRVRANFGPTERGSTLISLTPDGVRDPILCALERSAPMIENHQDMMTKLPPNATLLASSDAVKNQAFIIGKHVRAIQFHPEASAADLASWDDAALSKDGFDQAELIARAQEDDAANTSASRRLIGAFASEVLEWARNEA